jgi:membrane-bound lytic murein transglycosylase B
MKGMKSCGLRSGKTRRGGCVKTGIGVWITMLAATMVLIASAGHSQTRAASTPAGAPLLDAKLFVEDLLVSKGHKRTHIRSLMLDPRLSIDDGFIIKNLFHSAPRPSAKQPEYMEVDPRLIKQGPQFVQDHKAAFALAEQRFGASPEIITSILIIETKLGRYPMKYDVFRAYASLCTALDAEYLDSVLESRQDGSIPAPGEEVYAKARKKGSWAINELSCLIELAAQVGIDPMTIRGSFAGALGPAQFIPSSFIKYGVDGNGDGRRNPFDMDDAIASIGNYLKLSGWKEDAPLEKKRQAVWAYNHYTIYVNTVMMVYDRLKSLKDRDALPEVSRK